MQETKETSAYAYVRATMAGRSDFCLASGQPKDFLQDTKEGGGWTQVFARSMTNAAARTHGQ